MWEHHTLSAELHNLLSDASLTGFAAFLDDRGATNSLRN